ncbi:DNA/RNA non-specific endonuclease [Lactococcus kimchii]|uniref:DNA/RNA non-specific endonuclease n=1 Tax=Lactococcus sp. S-13 TaxID=2507158 RepID=UPI001023875A|nr:DNA/RNA non-specific endonuclease [Lactococcus sp. S-13]RZI49547.1 DNAse [Lactococcus sp. S-13]
MNKKQKKSLTSLLILLVALAVGYFGSDKLHLGSKPDTTPSTTLNQTSKMLPSTIKQQPLPFKNQKQMVMADTDALGRAVDSHIQLKNSQEPRAKREPLTYNPVGWHNYNFYYKKDNGSIGKMWLMARGHLVGYQFCGLNNEARNLVPETAWFNGGSFVGMDDGNTASMLYYENRLDSWLANHPNYYLDYQVTPIYKGNELLPRQIRLAYVGIDQNGEKLTIKLGGGREKTGLAGATVVVLDNVAPNAKINYADGTAVNTVNPN